MDELDAQARDIVRQALDLAVSHWLRDLSAAQGAGLPGVSAAHAERVVRAQALRDRLAE